MKNLMNVFIREVGSCKRPHRLILHCFRMPRLAHACRVCSYVDHQLNSATAFHFCKKGRKFQDQYSLSSGFLAGLKTPEAEISLSNAGAGEHGT